MPQWGANVSVLWQSRMHRTEAFIIISHLCHATMGCECFCALTVTNAQDWSFYYQELQNLWKVRLPLYPTHVFLNKMRQDVLTRHNFTESSWNLCKLINWWQLVYNMLQKTQIFIFREKGRDLTQSCDKNPYTHRTIQKATWQHKNATKNFDYTTIADRLRTVSWSNSSHPTGVVKPVYERSTFPLTATAV